MPAVAADQRELVDLVRRFGLERVRPRVRAYDAAEEVPADILAGMAELGLFGGVIPDRWGGAGLSHTAFAAVIEELSSHDHALGMLASMPSALVGGGLAQHGTDAQRQRWLAPLASGDILGGVALTEPDAGSDPAALSTRYRATPDGFVLDGVKTWISNVATASFFIVFATRDRQEGRRGISAFLVPADAAGLQRNRFRDKGAFRPMSVGELVLDGVEVGPDALLGDEGGGWGLAMSSVERGRLFVGAQAVGLARAALEDSVAHVTARRIGGRPLAEYQLTEKKIADMAVGIESARMLVRACAEALDAGTPHRMQSSMAKLLATEVAVRAAGDAFLLHGASAISDELRIGRLFRDSKVLEMGEGPNEVHRSLIAQYVTGRRS